MTILIVVLLRFLSPTTGSRRRQQSSASRPIRVSKYGVLETNIPCLFRSSAQLVEVVPSAGELAFRLGKHKTSVHTRFRLGHQFVQEVHSPLPHDPGNGFQVEGLEKGLHLDLPFLMDPARCPKYHSRSVVL